MADLLAHGKETELAQVTASTSASATTNNIQEYDDAEEEAQLQIATQQVEASNAEEGVEIAESDAKITQLKKELRGDIASVSAAAVLDFKQKDFKEGMTNVNLPNTRNELHNFIFRQY